MNRHWLWRAGLFVVALASASGCTGGSQPTDETTYDVRSANLPDLPGCDSRARVAHGRLTARPLLGGGDLVVVFSDGSPLCIDTLQGAATALNAFVVLDTTSGSVPDQRGYASSDPMPGIDPAASDPMPGKGGSDPMPGTANTSK